MKVRVSGSTALMIGNLNTRCPADKICSQVVTVPIICRMCNTHECHSDLVVLKRPLCHTSIWGAKKQHAQQDLFHSGVTWALLSAATIISVITGGHMMATGTSEQHVKVTPSAWQCVKATSQCCSQNPCQTLTLNAKSILQFFFSIFKVLQNLCLWLFLMCTAYLVARIYELLVIKICNNLKQQ